MATRSAPKEIVGKAAEHLTPRRLKEVKRAAPKAALSVARSLGSGESAAKAAVTALKGAGERVLGEKSKGATGKRRR